MIIIQPDKAYSNFIDVQKKCIATKKAYAIGLRRFMKYVDVNSANALIGDRTDEMQNQVVGFIQHLQKEGLSPQSQHNYLNALKFFYAQNDRVLN